MGNHFTLSGGQNHTLYCLICMPSYSIFAGVLVTLALVMISTINTTRARAGFDSQAESLILFAAFSPARVPLAAFSAETRRLSITSCSVAAIESFNHRSQVKPLRPVGIHRSWSTASFYNCAESALPEVGIHGQTRHQCHRRPWSRRPWPRSNGKLNYRSRNVPTRRHEIVSNVDRLRRFGTAAQLGLHHRRG